MVKKICAGCGKEFDPAKGHERQQKYCGRSCQVKSNNAKRYSNERLDACLECGDWLEQGEGRGRLRLFCSDACRIKYHARKAREERRNQERPMRECPNCGANFPKWRSRRYCSEECRRLWYEKQRDQKQISEEAGICRVCGKVLAKPGRIYCSQECQRKAMEGTHETRICPWCGSEFITRIRSEQRYCSRKCAVADRQKNRGVRKGSHRITAESPESWKEKLTRAARVNPSRKRGKQVRLVCGDTSMYNGLDGLISIIRYTLQHDPYDGRVYVFRDSEGSMLKYIEWDGRSFLQGKRRAQSGTYPWPPGEPGNVVEINEREFEYLLSRSIVPFKEKAEKCCDG